MPLSLLVLLACGPSPEPVEAPVTRATSPITRRSDTVATYHGVDVPDPYDWLEDPDAPEVREWIAAQNVHTRAWIDEVAARDGIIERLQGVWQNERRGVPVREAGRVFYEHNDGTQNQSVLRMADGIDGPAVTLLDPNTFSPDGTASLRGWAPSPDGRFLQYGVSDGGSDWTRFEVLELPSGKRAPDRLEWIKFSEAAWKKDGSGFFYARYPATDDPTASNLDHTVYFHRMGTAQSDDVKVHATPDHPDWGFDLEVTADGRWLVITASSGTEERTGISVLDLTAEGASVRSLFEGFDADHRVIGARGDTLFLRTTRDAPRYRVVAVDLRAEAPWREVVPQGADVIEQAVLVGDALVVATLKDARSELSVWGLDGTARGAVELPGLGSVDDLRDAVDGPVTHFAYTSFTQPSTVVALDVGTLDTTMVFAPKVPFDPKDFRTEQVFVAREDGVRVPMFLSWKGDARPTAAPTLLYGYGGFNIPVTPGFNARNLVWMELGGVYASANLRGGGEYGETWHEAGTKTRKQNVFDDAIACAEWLVDRKVTRPDRLALHGRSNGGLLAGAVLVQRPDLFGAVIPTVGVLDMLKYHTWTIGWAWASDYGTADDRAEFEALLAYSPVHNARPASYPPVLIETADHDDRVVPAHSFKFAAALQHAQGGEDPVLIRVETAAGHGAGKSQAMRIDEDADELAFLVRALGVDVR